MWRLRGILPMGIKSWQREQSKQTLCGGIWLQDNGYKLKDGKFLLSIRKNLFYSEAGQTLVLVARRYCNISMLGDIQILTGYGAGQPALVDLSVNRGLDDLQKGPLFLTILIPCDFISMTGSQNSFLLFFLSLST